MTRRIIVSAVLIILLLAIGGGVVFVMLALKPTPPTVSIERPPLLVSTLKVEPQVITEELIGYGTAEADRYAWLSSEIEGEIKHLRDSLRPGAHVESDEVLLRIDDREYRHRLERATSRLDAEKALLAQLDVEEENVIRLIETSARELESATWEYEKVSQLYDVDNATQRELEQSRLSLERTRRAHIELENRKTLIPIRREQLVASVANSMADVELAKIDIEHCEITSPFAGVIDELKVELGEHVQPSKNLLSIIDPDLIEIPVRLPVSVYDRVRTGAGCELQVETMLTALWRGTVTRLSPQAREATRTFIAYVEVDNREHAQTMLPGYFVRAAVEGQTLTDAMLVPRGSVLDNKLYVYRPKEGKAYLRYVTIDRHLVDRTAVLGLEPGDLVITSNLDALFDGIVVTPAEETISADPDAVTAERERTEDSGVQPLETRRPDPDNSPL